MSVSYPVPLDSWGFTIGEIRNILNKDKRLHARITKETFAYNTLKGFHISDVGEYRIVVPTSKKLHQAIRMILDKKRERDNPQKYKSIFDQRR